MTQAVDVAYYKLTMLLLDKDNPQDNDDDDDQGQSLGAQK